MQMQDYSVNTAQAQLAALIEQVNRQHQPVTIRTAAGTTAVLVPQRVWDLLNTTTPSKRPRPTPPTDVEWG